MRTRHLFAGLPLALVLAATARADPTVVTPTSPKGSPVLYTARVKEPLIEVRSGPSTDPKMYPTNHLKYGDLVEVVSEEKGGWLGIKPPAGSFSYVNMRFLEKLNATTWMVRVPDGETVEVNMGSALTDPNQKPDVISAHLKRGTQVVSRWNPYTPPGADGVYLPIVPPDSEVRYIEGKAVEKVDGAAAAAPSAAAVAADFAPPTPTPTSTAPPPLAVRSGPGAAAPAAAGLPPGTTGNEPPEWFEAQRLAQAGQTEEAIKMYHDLAKKVLNTDHDLAMRCHNQAHFLRMGMRASVPAGYDPTKTSESHYPATSTSRLTPIAAGVALQAPAGCVPCPGAPQPQQSAYAPAPPPGWFRSGPGSLRRAGRGVDDRVTYVHQGVNGQGRLYVTPAPGLNLDAYLNGTVEVYGPVVYRGDLRAYYMTASLVVPAPSR
jgi:SH3-like domain-containing protein